MAPSSNCVSTFPETSRFAKTMWLLGCVSQGIGYGILLLLAFTCFQALRKRKGGSPRINKGLIVYTLLSAALATAAEVTNITLTFRAVLDDTCVGPYLHLPDPYLGPADIVSFMATLLSDGLLVSAMFLLAMVHSSYLGLEMLCDNHKPERRPPVCAFMANATLPLHYDVR